MTETFQFGDKLKRNLFIAMALGLVGLVLAFFLYPENNHSRLWTNILVNAYYFTGIGIFGIFFVAAHQLGYGGWIALVRRVILSLSGFVVVGGSILLVIVALTWVGGHNIYDHWVHLLHNPELVTEKLTTKVVYLSLPFWTARIFIYVVLWVVFGRLFSKFLDNDLLDKRNYKVSKLLAAVWIVIFAVSESAISWDMIMSIDPHWYSTLFGWYNFASYGCAAFAFSILLVIYLKSQGYLAQVTENHVHDLGTFLFGFSVFWTYLWFSQFMLQWYANIPEDTLYWAKRFDTGFKISIFVALAINFLLPLLVLMTRGAKRNYRTVAFAAVMIIVGHQMDFCNMVMYEPNVPAAHGAHGGEHHAALSSASTTLYAENTEAVKEEVVPAVATDATETHAADTPATTETHVTETKVEDHDHAAESHAKEAHAAHADAHGHAAEVKSYAGFGLVEILIFIGFAGAFLFMFFLELAKHPLINEKDPYFQESVKHHI
jgi:hypothetical protein